MAAKTVNLSFVAWTWNPDFIGETVERFERTVGRNDDLEIAVDWNHYDWADYPEKVDAHVAAGKPVDVLYVSDDWLSDWASSDRIAPLEDYRPEIRSYACDFEDFNTQGMSYGGKLYGLPYYCDRFGLVYNQGVLREAGIAAPPRTWDELVAHCRTITSKTGMKHPLTLPFGSGPAVVYPVALEAFYSLVYSRPDGWCFTPDLEPLFGRESAAADVLRWCLDAQDKLAILDPLCSDQGMEGVIDALQRGKNAFTLVATYCMKEIRNPEHTDWPQRFHLALMPGTGDTVGYSRFYAVTNEAVRRGDDHLEAAWRLIEFLGGKSDPERTGRSDYHTMRNWILEDGLGFAQKSLFHDPEVRQALGDWIDVDLLREQAGKVKHKRGMEAAWWRQWYVLASQTIRAAMRHDVSCEQALDDLTREWLRLKTTTR